jgi:hypothetical protein
MFEVRLLGSVRVFEAIEASSKHSNVRQSELQTFKLKPVSKPEK